MSGIRDERGFTVILRVWREQANGAPWRCAVEDPRTRQQRGFADAAQLLAFLEGLLHQDTAADGEGPHSVGTAGSRCTEPRAHDVDDTRPAHARGCAVEVEDDT